MKVALYIRVSTEDQVREGTSLEVQREFLENYAKRESWEIYYPEKDSIYKDDGYSGYTLERPALTRLLKDAKRKKFNVVLVYKIDRFARNNRLLLNLVEELDNIEIGFKSATEAFDTVSAAGKLALSMLGTVAQFERDRIIERVFPGMIKGVQRGNWQGARYSPYGYRYNKERKLLEVVSEEADIVKMIYLMYLSGQSTMQVAGYLYNKGYKTRSGGRFHTKLICDILKSQTYLGKLVWNKKHYDKSKRTLKGCSYVRNNPSDVIVAQGRHEAIICQEDFDDVQRKLAEARKGNVKKANSREYPLTGILFCARCGNRFQGCANVATRVNGKTETKRRYYRCCARQTYYIKCENSYVRADELEAEIFNIIKLIFSEDIDENRLRRLIENTSGFHGEEVKKNIADAKLKLNVNLSKQEKLSGLFSENLLAMEVYRKQIIPLREEEEDLKSKIKKLELRLIERERSKEYIKLLESVASHFDDLKTQANLSGKKWLLRLVFKSIKIDNGRIKKMELYEPFKGLYEGVKIKCQLQEIQGVPAIEGSVSTLLPPAVR
ncbi:MAG: recombinase family protein [Candidatus Omnitrophota bacterium]